MTNARDKGQRGEREFAKIVEEFLPELRLERGDQSRGGHASPDLVGLHGWWVEVKRTERPTLGTWWAKITGDTTRAKSSDRPLIAWRPNRGEWLTILRARDLLWLFRWCENMARTVEKAEATALRLAGRELELLAEIDALKNPRPAEPIEATQRYPLRCIDKGEGDAADRYVGPFSSEDAAHDAWTWLAGRTHPDAKLRRCRALKASEVLQLHSQDVAEEADEDREALAVNCPDEAWGFWSSKPVVRPRDPSVATTALEDWADAHLEVEIFVCEGDEP